MSWLMRWFWQRRARHALVTMALAEQASAALRSYDGGGQVPEELATKSAARQGLAEDLRHAVRAYVTAQRALARFGR